MNKQFWKAALIRALRTIAQTAIATIGTTAVIEEVRWLTVLSASALAGLLSLLTSIATGLPEVDLADSDVGQEDLDPYDHVRIVYLDEEDKPPDGEGRIVFLNNEEGEQNADR